MFRIRDRRVRQHLLHMCDFDYGITRAQQLPPESHSGLLFSCSPPALPPRKALLDVTEAEYGRFLGIILKGKFFAAQAAAKAMKAAGRCGAIVQTGSYALTR